MSVYRLTEVMGTSAVNYGEATARVFSAAGEATPDMEWFDKTEFAGRVRDGEMEFRVKTEVAHLIKQEDR